MCRKSMKKSAMMLSIVVLWLLGPAANEAQAYIDPGTGSSLLPSLGMMLAVMSAFLAVMFTQFKRISMWIWIIVSGFRRRKKKGT